MITGISTTSTGAGFLPSTVSHDFTDFSMFWPPSQSSGDGEHYIVGPRVGTAGGFFRETKSYKNCGDI